MDGVWVDLRSGEEVTCTEQNGQKKLVRVRERVRITFSFISTGTGSVPVHVLRGRFQTRYLILRCHIRCFLHYFG